MTSPNPQEGGKHTPGPWQMSRHGNLVGSNGATVVVWGSGLTNAHRGPEAEANARLISAAPALLEALTRLLRTAEDELYDAEHAPGVRDARAAILQATGGENGR